MTRKSSERLIEIVAGAAQRPPAEREAFVRSSLADPAEVSEALALLGALRSAGDFMNRPTLGAGQVAPIGEGPGSVLGRYRLESLIGEGGFGAVFSAQQLEPIRREVAIKIIKLGMDTRAVVARFEAERQALAMMDHPNIAKVLDAGATESGRPYFVMELVAGRPITRYCDEHALPTAQRLELFLQVCHAVQHAHQKGIIHRDIKPSNVLVCGPNPASTANSQSAIHNPSSPVVKVIDFGIAKATAARLTEKTVFTEHRTLIGTPEYMSPEQADRGGGDDIDTRSDIYSLGVLLYELLTGVTPFDGATLRSAAFGEIQRIIREVEPPRPSTRLSGLKDALPSIAAQRGAVPAKLPAQLRGDLDWIVMKCLEKERSRRYDSAAGLAQDLQRHLNAEPVLAAPPGAAYRLKKFVRRHRVGVAAGAAVALALVGGLAVALWQANVAAHERDLQAKATAAALAAKKDADDERLRLEQVAGFQASQLKDIDVPLMGQRLKDGLLADVKSGMQLSGATADQIASKQEELAGILAGANMTNLALTALDQTIFQRALEAVDKQFKDQPIVRARLLQTLATTMRQLGLMDGAAAAQSQALSLFRANLGEEHKETLNSILESAQLLAARGQYAAAEASYREAIEKMRRVLGDNDRQTISAIDDLGESLQQQGRVSDAEPFYREALERALKTFGPEDIDTINCRNNLGFMLYAKGDLEAAGKEFEQSLSASRRVAGDDDEGTIGLINNLASIYQHQGKLALAEPMFREGLERCRRVRGDDHPLTLQLMNNMGHILLTEGKLAQAEPYLKESLDRRRRVLTSDHLDTMQSLNNMGALRQDQKRYEEAEAFYREALERRRRVLGPTHQATLQSMNSLASLLQTEGHLDAAEPLYREALDLRKKNLEPDHPDILQSLNNLAVLLMAQNKPEQAEPLFREALGGRERRFGKDHPFTAASRVKLAEALTSLSHFDEAQGLLLAAEPVLAGPDIPKGRHTQCVRDLAALYEAWDKAAPGQGYLAKAEAWRARLEQSAPSGQESAPATPTK